MKRLLLLTLTAIVAMCVSAAKKTDEIPGTLTITASYSQQVLECESGSAWIMTLKNEGDGPQMKPGSGGIVTKTSIGMIRKIEVTWGGKSNEDIVIYGSHEPIADPKEISGEVLGTVAFSANATTSLDITGDWEYVGMTASAKKGKACQFVSMNVTWEVEGEEPEADVQEGLVINEVCGNDGTASDGSEDWVELANATDKTISYEGIKVVKVDDDGTEETIYTTPETTVIKELKPGEYLLVKRTVDFESGISNSKNIIIKLVSASGNVIDKFDKRKELTDNGHHLAGGSYSRIPDLTGEWAAVQNATPGAANDATPIAVVGEKFQRISSEAELVSGMEFILVNESIEGNECAMSASWSITKDGSVYQLAETVELLDCEKPMLVADVNRVAVLTLEDAGNGQWAIKFGETGNYKNEGRYLACEVFKNLDFKKSIDKKGVACDITFNEGGDAEISYGELAGSLKFNYKGDGTDRFMNYDPADKPEDHLGVHIYCKTDWLPTGIKTVNTEKASSAIYNLAGQKVSSGYKGIVIVNGKKILRNF